METIRTSLSISTGTISTSSVLTKRQTLNDNYVHFTDKGGVSLNGFVRANCYF